MQSTAYDRSSDENDVVLQVRERLQCSEYSTVRSVSCQIQAGKLILSGSVPNFFSLQAAIHLALRTLRESHLGEVRLQNEIQVVTPESPRDPTGDESAH